MEMATAAACGMPAVLPARFVSQNSVHAFACSSSSSGRISGFPLRCSYTRSPQSRLFCVAAPSKVDAELETEDANEDEGLVIPTSAEIETLLKIVCDETKIAELGVKVGSFNLRVKRNVTKAAAPVVPAPLVVPDKPSPAPLPAPVKPKPSVPKVSPLMTKSVAYHDLQNAAAESGVVFVNAPKVGLFRQGRFVKGKFGPPLCREGQAVKEGQIVCYLEQFGTQMPVEVETSGDVVKVFWEDGVPVGYGDPLIALKPKKV